MANYSQNDFCFARRHWWLLFILAIFASCAPSANPTLGDLWAGRAQFQDIGEIRFDRDALGIPPETATWYAVKDGRWFAFSRVVVNPAPSQCRGEHRQVVVRQSDDKGKSWSPPVVAIRLGMSKAGDGCAVLDGSTYYDATDGVWHILAQCMALGDIGGWGMCHYIRRAASPKGPFVADPLNPVVRRSQLWSRICGTGPTCPAGLIDEGTPDIVGKSGGAFTVTMHGYDPATGRGFRGVVSTPDFHSWTTAAAGLPHGATLSRSECEDWFPNCAGFGEASSLVENGHIYTIVETMDRTLSCQKDQRWVFVLFRSKGPTWPTSGTGDWELSPKRPFLKPTWPDPQTPCILGYAHFIRDRGAIYLTYEDWEPEHRELHRRLLKLVGK